MSCSHKNEPFNRFCTTCGKPIERKICHCGAANQGTSAFCYCCGYELLAPEENKRSTSESERIKKSTGKPSLKDILHAINNRNNDTNDSKESVSQTDINTLFGKKS